MSATAQGTASHTRRTPDQPRTRRRGSQRPGAGQDDRPIKLSRLAANTSSVVAAADTTVDPAAKADDGPIQAWHPAAELLSALADPIRLAVLSRLATGTVHVSQLLEEIPVAPNLLSYHLRVLREAGLICACRRGRCIDYRLAEDAIARLHAAIPTPAQPIPTPTQPIPTPTRPSRPGCE
jgi:ArsR family transcriptional regulator